MISDQLPTEPNAGDYLDLKASRMLAGLASGNVLQGEGVLLDHRLATASVAEARSAAYAKLSLESIQDWALDYSEQACIWVLTSHAWYR